MKDTIYKVLLLIAFFASVTVTSYLGVRFLELKERELNDIARRDCANIYRLEVKESETFTGFYPVEEKYRNCLKEKGL